MRSIPLAVFVVLTALSPALAQAPKGQLVVCSFNPWPGNLSHGQTGGLFLVHPRNPGVPIAIQGLPLELTGAGLLPPFTDGGVGANAIVALPDGDLLVADQGNPNPALPVNASADVHRIRLMRTGAAAWSAQIIRTYPIATVVQGSNAPGGAQDLELLPNGRVLVSLVGNFQSGMSGARLAELDLASGVVRVIPVNGFSDFINALAVSADGQKAYLGRFQSIAAGGVWTLPLPNGGAAAPLLTSLPGVMAIDRDNQGNLVVGTIGGGSPPCFGAAPNLFRVGAATGNAVSVLANNVLGVRNAVLVERNTGTIFTGDGLNVAYVQGNSLSPLTQTAPWTCSSPNSPAWGIPAGFAMVPAIDEFGSQAGGAAPYEWQTAPNPGGPPLMGNVNFSITLTTTASPQISVWALATAVANPPLTPIAGVTQLLAPQTILGTLWTFAPPATQSLPLPIPSNPCFSGLSLFGQTFHLDVTGTTSSSGLCITIL